MLVGCYPKCLPPGGSRRHPPPLVAPLPKRQVALWRAGRRVLCIPRWSLQQQTLPAYLQRCVAFFLAASRLGNALHSWEPPAPLRWMEQGLPLNEASGRFPSGPAVEGEGSPPFRPAFGVGDRDCPGPWAGLWHEMPAPPLPWPGQEAGGVRAQAPRLASLGKRTGPWGPSWLLLQRRAGMAEWRLLLLLLLLFPPGLLGGEEGRGASAPSGETAAPSLPLIQMLLSQAPPRAQSRGWRQASRRPLHYMLELYRRRTDRHGRPHGDWQHSSNMIRLVRPSAKARQAAPGPWLVWTLDYHLEAQLPTQQLVRVAAVYAQMPSSNHGPFWCTTTLPSHGSPRPLRDFSFSPPQNATATSAQESWVEKDLLAFLQPWAWAARKSRLLRLSHACTPLGQPGGVPPRPAWEDPPALEDPFLLLYLNDTRKGLRAPRGDPMPGPFARRPAHDRRTRQAGPPALDLPGSSRLPGSKQNKCALHPFRVSFRQLGWDHWIIAPHWYRPQYCKGSCPRLLRYGYHSPNHAVVQNLINELVDQRVPRPSCVPYEYGPISVLMIEQNHNILYKVYEDMIAKSCTCR